MVGKAVGHQLTGVEMSKGRAMRQFGAWEGCRSPTYRSGHVKG